MNNSGNVSLAEQCTHYNGKLMIYSVTIGTEMARVSGLEFRGPTFYVNSRNLLLINSNLLSKAIFYDINVRYTINSNFIYERFKFSVF